MTPSRPDAGPPLARTRWTRRRFITTSGLTAAGLFGGLGVACSDDDGDGAAPATSTTSTTKASGSAQPDAAGIVVDDLASEAEMFGWIEEVVSHGIRRPGYEADVWAEDWIQERFEAFGLEDVHREPVPLRMWTPGRSTVTATPAGGEARELDHFQVPYAKAVDDLDLELVAYDPADPGAVAGKASLSIAELLTLGATLLGTSGSVPKDMTGRIIDDEDESLANGTHTVPFSADFQAVATKSIAAGAAAFIGSLAGSPGDTYEYFVPYDGKDLPIPGVWISESDGRWLLDRLAEGPVRISLTVASEVADHTSYNIVGDLPGADDEVVIIGSHHDGPWASAVEDGSGISMVLAQARYWSRQDADDRPHRLRFILQGGHMCGGAGLLKYVEDHEDELDQVVLELHLEHACLDAEEDDDGEIVVTDKPVPRWWFTSRHASLEKAVAEALAGEELTRSMVMAPDAFGDRPPTDGNAYYAAGVPIVQFLAAPWYLFDSVDTLDKIDRDHLVPITRAAARIVASTAGTSASDLRAEGGTP